MFCGDAGGFEGSGEVVQIFLVSVIGQLPSAEMAGDGLFGMQLLHDVYGVFRVGVVGAYPVRAVGADGEERNGRRAEAAIDVIKTTGGSGVARKENVWPGVGLDGETAPKGAVAALRVAVAAAPV